MSDFVKRVLENSPLLNLVIGTHLLVEEHLRQELKKSLKNPGALITDQGPSFSHLVSISEAVGVVESDLAAVFRALNALRNKYAHRLSFEASSEQVERLLRTLREMDNPFFVSYVPGSERELGIALASLSGWLERNYGAVQS